MSLTVDSKNIPVGVLALIAKHNLNITVQAGSETSLKVDSITFNSASNAVRYIIRANNLLDESNAENQAIAHALDLALAGHVEALKALVAAAKDTPFLGGGGGAAAEPSAADYVAWCVLRQTSSDSNYVKAVEATPAAQDALKKAEELKACAPKTTAGEVPEIPGSDPSSNPIDTFKNVIAAQIAAIGNIDPVVVYGALDNPRSVENGDLAIALPRLRVKGNPAAIAKEWAAAFVPNDYIIEAAAAGPFLNFRFNKALLTELTLNMVSKSVEQYGENKAGQGKTVVVEFSSPNIAKPFHAGHLRSTIIGAFVRNIYHANGWKTITMNYLGDWGKQYGKLSV